MQMRPLMCECVWVCRRILCVSNNKVLDSFATLTCVFTCQEIGGWEIGGFFLSVNDKDGRTDYIVLFWLLRIWTWMQVSEKYGNDQKSPPPWLCLQRDKRIEWGRVVGGISLPPLDINDCFVRVQGPKFTLITFVMSKMPCLLIPFSPRRNFYT